MCTFSPQEETCCTPPTEDSLQLRAVVGMMAFAYSRIPTHSLYHIRHRMSRASAKFTEKKFLAAPRSLAPLAPAPALRASAAPLRAALPCGGLARHGVRRSCAPVRIRARLRPALPAPLGFVGRFAFVRRGLRWGRGHCAGVCASITVCGAVPPALR